MNITELIAALERVRDFHGNIPVIVTGLYASSADDLEVVHASANIGCNEAHVEIQSSICSG